MAASGKTNKYYDAYNRKAVASSPATPSTEAPKTKPGMGNKQDFGATMLKPSQPSFQEQQRMMRSEDSSIEKLKKHMEKQKTSKKEGV